MKLEVIEKIRENRNISYKIGFFFMNISQIIKSLEDVVVNAVSFYEIKNKEAQNSDKNLHYFTKYKEIKRDKMEIRLLVSKEIDEMEDTLYLDSLHIKDEYKGVSVSIMNSNDRARNLYTKLGAIHLNDYNNYETKYKRLYWKLF